jgi:glutamate-1-semialdehyde 2,1-aminomutase
VWDLDGNEYIDFRNSLGPITLGYRFPAVDDAIRAQLDKGIIFGHPSPLEGEVAELLVDAIPCAEKVRYLKTGGEAMAAAIKAARAFTGRDMVLQCGYNGWLNSLAVGGAALPGQQQQAPLGVPMALAELHRAMPWDNLEPWEQAFDEFEGRIACACVAMTYADPEKGRDFLPALRALTAKHGVLLVTDEIVAGFRIAKGGLHEYADAAVDLAVFAKGIANGMPLSAVVGRADVMDIFGKAVVSSTYSGETLSLAAAKACITTYHEQGVIEHLYSRGTQWQRGLNSLFEQHDVPLAAAGLPPCTTFVGRDGASTDEVSGAMESLFRGAYANGVSLYNVAYTNFSHREQDIAEALKRIATGLAQSQ